MIECFVNADGYYIRGKNIEIARKLAPVTNAGEPLLDPLQHIYAVMYATLAELKGVNGNRIFVYNDSRIIDDLNGYQTLDSWYSIARTMIRQRLLPDIGGVVFFKKKSSREIVAAILNGMKSLCVDDTNTDKRLIEYVEEQMRQHEDAVRSRAADLKRRWFNAEA